MKYFFFFCALLISAFAKGGDIVDVADEIARAMGYPPSEITVVPVVGEESVLEKVPLLGAWRIEGKTANSFFPVVVAVANAGSLFDERIVALNTRIDALPDIPAPQGKGAFGSFSIGGDSKGGIHLLKHGRSVAVVSTLTMPDRNRDIRVSVECPFGPESLILVPGGDVYLKNMAADSGFDLKVFFNKVNQIAATLTPEPVGNTEPKRETTTCEMTSINTRENVVKSVEESRASFSSFWWIGALLLFFIIGGVLKVSSKMS